MQDRGEGCESSKPGPQKFGSEEIQSPELVLKRRKFAEGADGEEDVFWFGLVWFFH